MKKLIRDILVLPFNKKEYEDLKKEYEDLKKEYEDLSIYEDMTNMKEEKNSFAEPYYDETKDDKIIFSFEDLFEDFQRNGKELKKQEARKYKFIPKISSILFYSNEDIIKLIAESSYKKKVFDYDEAERRYYKGILNDYEEKIDDTEDLAFELEMNSKEKYINNITSIMSENERIELINNLRDKIDRLKEEKEKIKKEFEQFDKNTYKYNPSIDISTLNSKEDIDTLEKLNNKEKMIFGNIINKKYKLYLYENVKNVKTLNVLYDYYLVKDTFESLCNQYKFYKKDKDKKKKIEDRLIELSKLDVINLKYLPNKKEEEKNLKISF